MENADVCAEGYVGLGELRQGMTVSDAFETYGQDAAYDHDADACMDGKSSSAESFISKFISHSKWISKKAVFITSVPFYWFVLFRYVLHWFDMGFFVFVVAASIAMSFAGSGWGIINSAAN